MKYFCCNEMRREAVRKSSLNGIDYLEVRDRAANAPEERQRILFIHFLKPLTAPVPAKENIRIEGGERIVGIQPLSAAPGTGDEDHILKVELDRYGDYSTYTLKLVAGPEDDTPLPGMDVRLASIDFSFKAECPSDFDCKPSKACPPDETSEPDIDYLAKDYESFRKLMLDRMATTVPNWKERNPADLGVVLVELLAYAADQLSYQQDAVATEAYIGTARQRASVRRHARLMDYYMSDGRNARAWVHFRVERDLSPAVPGEPLIAKGAKLLSQIPGESRPTLPDEPELYFKTDVVFETLEEVNAFYKDHNELNFYTWSDQNCCLPRGATRATLRGHLPNLEEGTVLIFEEVIGPQTGVEADSNPERRHAVRLSEDGALSNDPVPVGGQDVTEICWHEEDALPFPFCVSNMTDKGYKPDISVARGNIVLADHGLQIKDEKLGVVPDKFLFRPSKSEGFCEPGETEPVYPRFRPTLKYSPVTQSGPFDKSRSASRSLHPPLEAEIKPSILLNSKVAGEDSPWEARRDLLNSASDDEDFVLEVENDGTARVRFGDDKNGKRPTSGAQFLADYRIGNGTAGNVGADALRHMATDLDGIEEIRNPLPAVGGRNPESIDEVRQRAPIAYRTQQRAVTEDDYAEVTERLSGVQRAAGTFRWTGSWHTAFVSVDREGGRKVTEEFEQNTRRYLENFRMAGYDLEVNAPKFVSLEIDMMVCVQPEYFRGDIKSELLKVLSARNLPGGRRGAFHPDNFTFGQPVYLSPIVAAAQGVQGVASVEITAFRRQGNPNTEARNEGVLEMGRLEIARLDNDPNFPERGVLRIRMGGGR